MAMKIKRTYQAIQMSQVKFSKGSFDLKLMTFIKPLQQQYQFLGSGTAV